MADIQYDDSNLYRLFEQLDYKVRRKALKGAFQRAANKVKRTAIANLRGTGINHAGELSRGIRAVVFKRQAGFRVTVGTKKGKKGGKGERGMYMTRNQGKKPVLIWVEEGTVSRRVKTKTRIRVKGPGDKWFTAGYGRGRMPHYGFMAKTASQVKGSVTDMLHKEIIDNINRVAKKYGCK